LLVVLGARGAPYGLGVHGLPALEMTDHGVGAERSWILIEVNPGLAFLG